MSKTYPDNKIPVGAKEEKEWALRFCQAIFYNYDQTGPNLFSKKRAQYRENRLWGIGRKSAEHLQGLINMDGGIEINGVKMNFAKLDFDVPSYVPRFREVVLGMLMKMVQNVAVDAVDKISVSKKLRNRHEILSRLILRPLMQPTEAEMPGMMPQGGGEGFVSPLGEPMDKEEFELFQQMPPKMREEIAMELFANKVLNENDWDEIRKQYCEDLVDNGVACTKDSIGGNGHVYLRYVKPDQFIVDFSERRDFANAMFMGEEQELSYEELSTSVPAGTFSRDEWEDIKNFTHTDFRRGLDNKYRVLDVEWRAENELVVEEKESQHGTSMAFVKDRDYEAPAKSKFKREVRKTPYPVIYKAKWIIGTQFIFDFGIVQNQKRGKRNMKQVEFSFHPYALGVVDGENKSMVEKMIPVEKSIQLKLVKIQHFIAQAKPKGIAVDVNALEGVLNGMAPLDLIKMYSQTGNQLFKRVDPTTGDQINGLPIIELENGMAGDVERLAMMLDRDIAALEDVTGINRIAAAAAPKSSDLIGTSQIALAGTDNALASLFSADQVVMRRTAKGIVQRLPAALQREHVKEYYLDALGEAHVEVLAALDGLQDGEYDVKIEAAPDEAEIAKVEQYIMEAMNIRRQLGKGGILLSDVVRVREILKTSTKMAWQYLVLRERKIAQMDAQAEKELVDYNSQQQQASAEQSAGARMQELQMDIQLKDGLEERKHERAKELMLLEHRLGLEKMEQDYEGKGHLASLEGDIKEDLLEKEALVYDEKTEARSHNIKQTKAGKEIGLQTK